MDRRLRHMKTVCWTRCSESSEVTSQKPVEAQSSGTRDYPLSAGSEQIEPGKITVDFTVLFDTYNLTEVTTQ